MNFTCGLLSRREIKAFVDADIVEKTKESGAILVGVTNIPELNLWCETRNNIYGQTNNPYNLNRTVGGSSGGEVSANIYYLSSIIFNYLLSQLCYC